MFVFGCHSPVVRTHRDGKESSELEERLGNKSITSTYGKKSDRTHSNHQKSHPKEWLTLSCLTHDKN
ncbi:MAG TPA: hypothetical protein V6C95_06080 [Coleofasciculaceae cyanobacterium]